MTEVKPEVICYHCKAKVVNYARIFVDEVLNVEDMSIKMNNKVIHLCIKCYKKYFFDKDWINYIFAMQDVLKV
jgi:uncharacterized protein with PIN domain